MVVNTATPSAMTGPGPGSELVGRTSTQQRRWSESDCIVHAISIGFGHDHLAYVSENTPDYPLRVLPTFAGALATDRGLLHSLREANNGRQAVVSTDEIRLHRPLNVNGAANVTTTVVDVLDRGEHAIAKVETAVRDCDTDQAIATVATSILLIGGGGFGGPFGADLPRNTAAFSDRSADLRIGETAALLYRLSGGDSAIHVDARVGQASGYAGPILQGRCLVGHGVRWMIDHVLGDGDPITTISARFRRPVFPGDVLRIEHKRTGQDVHRFQIERADGTVVLSDGQVTVRPITEEWTL